MNTDNASITVYSQHEELPPDSFEQVIIVLLNPNVDVENFLCPKFQKSYQTNSLFPPIETSLNT